MNGRERVIETSCSWIDDPSFQRRADFREQVVSPLDLAPPKRLREGEEGVGVCLLFLENS